ncbi:acyltransferase family protein [Pseudomonas typographi]|uniref:Acyltransferase n=1 Tax=Pseudomonas typographi TaxID=2715964 RepID=A0ABR7Z2P1_9PSED|nr:acyltransferase [Pseudomonas typographi]MBD1599632.1 acyltransferase [Pseudomonas typographi]
MKRFQALDSFRGVCAMCVAVYHLHIAQSVGEWAFFRNAHYLVSFFFVLSGFVMLHTYGPRLGCARQLKAFMISRTFRLYPLHVVMLVLAIGLEVMKLLAEQHGWVFNQPSFTGQRAVGEMLPNLLLVQAWWPAFNAQSFNYPAWSISVEYWTYLIFALLLWAFHTQALRLFAGVALAAFLALAVGYAGLTPLVWQGLSCFFAGAVTYRLYCAVRAATPVAPWLFTALEIASLGLVMAALVAPLPQKGILLSLLFCLVILVFAFDAGALSAWLRQRPFAMLGQLSYSIYMVHAFVIFFATLALTLGGKILGSHWVIYPSDGAPPYLSLHAAGYDNALLLALLAVIVGVSWFSYRLIELKGITAGKYLSQRGRSGVLAAREG